MDTTPLLDVEELEEVEASLDTRMVGVGLILIGTVLVFTGC